MPFDLCLLNWSVGSFWIKQNRCNQIKLPFIIILKSFDFCGIYQNFNWKKEQKIVSWMIFNALKSVFLKKRFFQTVFNWRVFIVKLFNFIELRVFCFFLFRKKRGKNYWKVLWLDWKVTNYSQFSGNKFTTFLLDFDEKATPKNDFGEFFESKITDIRKARKIKSRNE